MTTLAQFWTQVDHPDVPIGSTWEDHQSGPVGQRRTVTIQGTDERYAYGFASTGRYAQIPLERLLKTNSRGFHRVDTKVTR